MAGYYVREYYPDLDFELIDREIQLKFPLICLYADFYKFITKLRIEETNQLDFLFTKDAC